MRPSGFLQKRYPEALKGIAGEGTVQYIAFDDSGVDPRINEVDESTAYNATPISVPALIDLDPSKVMREKVGQDIEFNALLVLTKEHLEEKAITLKHGDAFLLPDDSKKYYIVKLMRGMQVQSSFLDTTVAVSRKRGSR